MQNIQTSPEKHSTIESYSCKQDSSYVPYILQALNNNYMIEFTLQDEFEELKIIGTIEQFDHIDQKVKIDGEWFTLQNVVHAFVREA